MAGVPAAAPYSHTSVGDGSALPKEQVRGHVAEVAERGYTIVRGAFDAGLIDALRAGAANLIASDGMGMVYQSTVSAGGEKAARFTGQHTARHFALLSRDTQLWWRPALHPNVLRIVHGVVGRDCLASSFSTALVGPGAEAQPFHTDDALYDMSINRRPLAKALTCNVIIALTDFTPWNGATRFVPGSHRWVEMAAGGFVEGWVDRATADRFGAQVRCAEMAAGDVLVYHGSLWHGQGANVSGRRRDSLLYNFCRGTMRQQENLMIQTPRERVAAMPAALRALVGYAGHSLGTGHTVEYGAPAALLQGGAPRRVPADRKVLAHGPAWAHPAPKL